MTKGKNKIFLFFFLNNKECPRVSYSGAPPPSQPPPLYISTTATDSTVFAEKDRAKRERESR
jgi:hypothetical protein